MARFLLNLFSARKLYASHFRGNYSQVCSWIGRIGNEFIIVLIVRSFSVN